MKEIKTLLQERIKEYHTAWQYVPGQDMAALLVELLEERFQHQQEQIAKLEEARIDACYALLEIPKRPAFHPQMKVEVMSENGIQIAKQTELHVVDAEGEDGVYQFLEDRFYQELSIQNMFVVDGKTHAICELPAFEKTPVTISLHKKRRDHQAICFQFTDVFEACSILSFHLHLLCDSELIDWLLDPTCFAFYGKMEDQTVAIPEIHRMSDGLQLEVEPLDPPFGATFTLWMVALRPQNLTPVHLYDASITWQRKQLRCTHIFGEDREYHEEDIPLFGAQMEIAQSCYLHCDEALSKRGAIVTIRFDHHIKCEEQGMELLQKKPYRGIMRQLPIELSIFDAYADDVVLEYFNGTSWRTIPGTVGIKHVFAQVEETKHLKLTFRVPDDCMPYENMGVTGYAIRLRLLESVHLYDRPCRIHVPYLSHVRFSYVIDQAIRPTKAVVYQQLAVEDITAQLGQGGWLLFPPFPIDEQAWLLALTSINTEFPYACSLTWRQSKATGVSVQMKYLDAEGNVLPLPFRDHTSNMTQPGELVFHFPPTMTKQTLFGIEAYWIALSFSDGQLPEMIDVSLRTRVAELVHISGTKKQPVDFSLPAHIPAEIMRLEGPYGRNEDKKEEITSRMAHRLYTKRQPYSARDIMELVQDEFPDVATCRLLVHQDACGQPSPHTTLILLFYDLVHHHSLFQMWQERIMEYLMSFQALFPGALLLQEPLFVQVTVHASCCSELYAPWETEQMLQQITDVYFDPIHGGETQTGWRIGTRASARFLTSLWKKQICDLQIMECSLHACYQVYGTKYFCQFDDLPIMEGMIQLAGQHQIHVSEVRKDGSE